MEMITDVVLKPFLDSIYIKPLTMYFKQNGRPRSWDMLEVHDSVSIIIHNTTKNALVFVKQFRPAVYLGSIPKEDRKGVIDIIKYPPELGITMELCAGIVDKDMPIVDIAREEILEECGYYVQGHQLEKVICCRTGVGTSGMTETMFYCEVTDDMKISDGGGVLEELIEVVEMPIPEVKEYIREGHLPCRSNDLMGIYWFLYHLEKEDESE